jgi:hypothetical protein
MGATEEVLAGGQVGRWAGSWMDMNLKRALHFFSLMALCLNHSPTIQWKKI